MVIWQKARDVLLAVDPSLEDDEIRLGDLLTDETAKADEIAIRLLRVSRDADMMVDKIDDRIDLLKERRDRFAKRRDRTREIALRVVEALGFPILRDAEFTTSKGTSPGGVHITDPDLVPDQFCKIERVPIKTLIGEAIKDGETVPGAYKTNGSVYLRTNPR